MLLSESPYWSRPPRDGYWGLHKRLTVNVISDGITRLPVLEGEISHIEIPRLSANLGVTVVGGADTALRCIVVQEVFADGLVAQDGRLRPGDQLIEINGTDTTSASHHQACQLLRKMSPVLRLGVYRERIEAYHSRNTAHYVEEMLTVELERASKQQLGVRLSGSWMEPGVYVVEVIDGSPAAQSGHFEPYDRIISINGEDVQNHRLEHASQLIQRSEKTTLVIARKKFNKQGQNQNNVNIVNVEYHSADEDVATTSSPCSQSESDTSPSQNLSDNYEANLNLWSIRDSQTWQAKLQQCCPDRNMNTAISSYQDNKSNSCEALDKIGNSTFKNTGLIRNRGLCTKRWSFDNGDDAASKSCRSPTNFLDCVLLQQKTVTIAKNPNESLGMRIGGGLGSNEGDIPIYIANIHPQGCVGQTQQVWKGDILLNVNGMSLLGLTHAQAVATLKATVENSVVTLGLLEGPETSLGAHNFIPSWLYWQRLPRCLQFPKTVTLNRIPGASLGFSIVGGEDPIRGPEPIHILFVVQESPAAKDGKLKCGDRLLAVDGHSLENVKHSTAVSMLKQTGIRVTLEVVSWLGTEL